MHKLIFKCERRYEKYKINQETMDKILEDWVRKCNYIRFIYELVTGDYGIS